MKRRYVALLTLAAVVVALGAAAVLVPLDTFKGPIETAAGNALKREVHIRGPLHLTLYPEIGISLGDVSVANAVGARDPEMATVGTILVGARLMPLFSRRLEVTEVVLKKPVIHLEVGRDGTANWQVPKDDSAPQTGARPGASLGVESARIEDGAFTYFDARSGKSEAISGVSLSLKMPAPDAAMRIVYLDGALTYHNEPLKVSARLEDFDAFMRGEESNTHVGVTSDVLNADFTGRVKSPGAVAGNLKLGSRSLRGLAAWTGNPMPPGNGFGLVALESEVSAKDGVYALSKANVAFDSMKLSGDVSVDTNPAIPIVKGMLAVDRIDVKPYLAPGASDDTVKAAKASDPDAPLALGGLKAVDADLTLNIGGLLLPGLTLDRATVVLALKGGVMTADLNTIAAYGGTGKGRLIVDAGGAVPNVRSTLDMTGIKVQPFLNQMMGVNRIAATGAVHYDVTSHGESSNAIVKSLNGKGEVRFTNGEITGVDLGAVARLIPSLLSGQSPGNAVGDNAKTQFTALGGSFTIQDGVMRTSDIALASPALAMTGGGTVDLARREMDLTFDPHARQAIAGSGTVDIGLPFYVKGPWAKPSYGPDTRNLAKGIVQAVGGITANPTDFLKNPGKALKSLFGGR